MLARNRSMRFTMFAAFVFACVFAGCKWKDIPTEFPTPEAPPPATPVTKLELKPDAELEKQIAKIAEEAKGKVGVAADGGCSTKKRSERIGKRSMRIGRRRRRQLSYLGSCIFQFSLSPILLSGATTQKWKETPSSLSISDGQIRVHID